MFSVVVVLFTAVSPPNRRGLVRNGQPLLFVLRNIGRQQHLLPPADLLLLSQSTRDRRTLGARSKQKWHVPGRRIPQSRSPEDRRGRRGNRSPGPLYERAWHAEKIVPVAPHSLVL